MTDKKQNEQKVTVMKYGVFRMTIFIRIVSIAEQKLVELMFQ